LQNPNFSLVLPNRSSVAVKYMPCRHVILSAVNRRRAVLWQRRGSCNTVGRCTAWQQQRGLLGQGVTGFLNMVQHLLVVEANTMKLSE